ncbi:HAD-IA family hydrolase [Candidatus Saccharibacteria bacterium]|nr:HAD-IA family hydrolase [Candidatus Saccharibacteria bacterium]
MHKKALIFDLNGVFVISPKLSERIESDFSVPLDIFLPVLKVVMDHVRQPGAKDVFYYWQPYFQKWGIKFTKDEFAKYCFSAEKPDEELVNLARRLKAKGLKLFVLSNNFRGRTEYYSNNFAFLDEVFDKVYYSWQTGFAKPDTRAWRNILDENNLKAEDCMYFDDSEKNVEAAESIGIESHIFNEDVVKMLESLVE